MLGQIESFRRDIGAGIIRCQDGRKVRFQRSHIINARESLVGEEVDFILNGLTPQSIIVLAGSPWSVFAGPETFASASCGRFSAQEAQDAMHVDWRMAA